MMYTVALYKNEEGQYFVFHAENKEVVEVFEKQFLDVNGYKMETCVITTERLVALKARLKFRIKELKSLDVNTDYLGYEQVVIDQVGLLTARLLNEGVDVTDEVALQCYDIRQKNRAGI